MTFVDSIKICFSKYADFNGRAGKSEFWWFMLFSFVVQLVFNIIGLAMVGSLFSLAVLLPSLAVGARRLHDTDKSGWWQLISLTGIGIFVLIFFWVQDAKEPNRFGTAEAAAAPADAAPGAQ